MQEGKGRKATIISNYYQSPFKNWIVQQYIEHQLSTKEIAEKIKKETNVSVSPRYIQVVLKSMGYIRNFSQAFNLAIKKGRKSYDAIRKPIKAKEFRKGISLSRRYEIYKRDNFRCSICGETAKGSRLVIDHIVPIVHGGTDELSNLRVLCSACNFGKKLYENER